ncbi:MAG TPA: lipoprotein [Usitatibacteraceae bacterium]|nr:lipoprotein [Usitatibacteraceae bacterium]
MIRLLRLASILAAVLALLGACGQKGPLKLPPETPKAARAAR